MNPADEGRERKYWCECVCGKAGGPLKHSVQERKEGNIKGRAGSEGETFSVRLNRVGFILYPR